MDIFKTHANILESYQSYINSFIHIKDDAIKEAVDQELKKGKLWPEPLIQFIPSFEIHGAVKELTDQVRQQPLDQTQLPQI